MPQGPDPAPSTEGAPETSTESEVVTEARSAGDPGPENSQVAMQQAPAYSAAGSAEAVSPITGPADQRSLQPSGDTTSRTLAGPPSLTGEETSQHAAQPGDAP